jgi:hypothetical protein
MLLGEKIQAQTELRKTKNEFESLKKQYDAVEGSIKNNYPKMVQHCKNLFREIQILKKNRPQILRDELFSSSTLDGKRKPSLSLRRLSVKKQKLNNHETPDVHADDEETQDVYLDYHEAPAVHVDLQENATAISTEIHDDFGQSLLQVFFPIGNEDSQGLDAQDSPILGLDAPKTSPRPSFQIDMNSARYVQFGAFDSQASQDQALPPDSQVWGLLRRQP